MRIWSNKEEAEHLKRRFEGVNRAEFARTNDVPGDQAIVYQHITGRRPISLEAAIAYAKGFRCTLAEISPRLAREVSRAVPYMGQGTEQASPTMPQAWPFSSVTPERWATLPDGIRIRAESLAEGAIREWEAANPETPRQPSHAKS